MKRLKKYQRYIFATAIFASLVGLHYVFLVKPRLISHVEAKESGNQNQKKCEGSSGNITGYIDTENLGPVYLDEKSYEDATGHVAPKSFYVEVDTTDPGNLKWSGAGYHYDPAADESVGFVNFSYDPIHHKVRFVEPGKEYDEADGDCSTHSCDKWGGWSGIVDLSAVKYDKDTNTLVGEGIDSHYTGGDDDDDRDDRVGSGKWTFEHVSFQDPACPQKVHLYINHQSSLYLGECPAKLDNAVLQWTSENVHGCKSLGASEYWVNGERPEQNVGTDVTATGELDESDSPLRFTLRCIGDFDDSVVEDSVYVSCGKNTPNGGGENDTTKVKPIIIES